MTFELEFRLRARTPNRQKMGDAPSAASGGAPQRPKGRGASGVVHLALQGACGGCPNSTQTLKFGIEERLKEAVPEVRDVVAF